VRLPGRATPLGLQPANLALCTEARAPEADPRDNLLAEQLVHAAQGGNARAVARLLAAGADPNASVDRRIPSGEMHQTTALILAAGHGRLEVARLLLDAGADPSLADGGGGTPLMNAVGTGEPEVLRLLLGRGAAVGAVERNGWTAFHMACYHNRPECAEALVRAGCDVSLKDKNSETGRELAEARGNAAVVERLRLVVAEQLRAAQAAAPEPEPVAAGGETPAKKLCAAAQEGDGAAIARLLAAGADLNASANGILEGEVVQSTALIIAAGHGHVEAARLLLDAGADPGRADGSGGTPLMVAAQTGQLEVLRLLLGRGAAVDAAEPSRRLDGLPHRLLPQPAGVREGAGAGGLRRQSQGQERADRAGGCGGTWSQRDGGTAACSEG
jgi:ankyrin repeat protein